MGLAPFYKIIGSPVRRTIQLLGALAFVPKGDVYDVYHSRVIDHPSFHIFCEAILTEQDLTAGKISQHKKKRLLAVRRKKWIDLQQQQQHDQCDQYHFDKAEEFLAYTLYMGYKIFTPVIRHLVRG